MPDNQPQTLTCPSCGAPLELDGKSAIIRCKFCRNVSIIPGFRPSQAAAPGLALEEIRRLAESGNLIEAIRQYRELYQVGLKDAKEAVEALRDGRLAERAEDVSTLESADLDEIRTLIKAGNKIEAIRRYRESYDVSLTRAKYAVEQLASGGTVEPGREAVSAPAVTMQPQPSTQNTGRLGCIITAAILLFVGGIIAFGMAQPGGPFVPRLISNGPAILLPSEQDTLPNVVTTLYDPDKENYQIGLIDSTSGKLLWTSDPLPESGYMGAVAQGGNLVYVAHDVDLLALHKTDGSLAWQNSMSDKLYGNESLVYSDGRIIAMGLDQSLQSFDAGSGQLVWSRQVGGFDRAIRLVKGSLLSIDYIDDNSDFGMVFLDPVDGSLQRTLTPKCQYNEYSFDLVRPDSGILYDQTEDSFYLIYGSPDSCFQRIDAASGQVTWATKQEDSINFSTDGFHPLNTSAVLYFGNDNQLIALDKSNGEVNILLDEQDYEFLPLTVTGDLLIVRARRTRGTERFELWGIDKTSGAQVWQSDLDKAKPLDPPNDLSGLVDNDESGWTWKLTPSGLVLIEFQAEPNQVVLKTIDPASGTALDEKTIALKKVSGDFYSVPELIGWQGQIAYFKVEINIYGFDISTGKIEFVH